MKINKILSILCGTLITAILSGCGSSSSPTPLACFVADGQMATSGNLYTVDLTTGAMTTVGAIGFAVTGMTYIGNTLYGVEATNSSGGSTNRLITINTATGAGTVVGTLTDNPSTDVFNVADITYSTDGILYGWSETPDQLVMIDPATGVVTAVPISTLSTFGSGLADINGTLYFVGDGTPELVTLNKADGEIATTIGTPAVLNSCSISGMTLSNGILYGLDNDCSGGGASITDLVSLDPATAVLTPIASYSATALDGIACNF